jgi:ferredoxin-type protein NapF
MALQSTTMSSDINHSRRGFLRGHIRSGPPPLRPPWALAEADFMARCTRCGNCAVICPTKIVRIHEGYPQLDFSAGLCTFCAECVRVCMPAALRREGEARPWQIIAVAADSCMAHTGVDCRICGEHCDESAIHFSPRVGGPPLPEIRSDLCTGCGACVAPCPVMAIRVR